MNDVRTILGSMEYGPAPESPEAVNAWLDAHGRKFGQFINNVTCQHAGVAGNIINWFFGVKGCQLAANVGQ